MDRVGSVSMSRAFRPSVIAVSGLVAGFAVARSSGRRELGGAVFAAAGAWCARRWWSSLGPKTAIGLGTLYLGAMGGSHPLAKKIGAWPSVAAVSALVATASEVSGWRRRGRRAG